MNFIYRLTLFAKYISSMFMHFFDELNCLNQTFQLTLHLLLYFTPLNRMFAFSSPPSSMHLKIRFYNRFVGAPIVSRTLMKKNRHDQLIIRGGP